MKCRICGKRRKFVGGAKAVCRPIMTNFMTEEEVIEISIEPAMVCKACVKALNSHVESWVKDA